MAKKVLFIWKQLTLLRQLVNVFSVLPHLFGVLLPTMLIIRLQALSSRRKTLCLTVVCKLRGYAIVGELVQLKLDVGVVLLHNAKLLGQDLIGVMDVLVLICEEVVGNLSMAKGILELGNLGPHVVEFLRELR